MIDRWPSFYQCAYWTLLSAFLITAQLAIVRHIANDIHVFEIVFFRGVFGLVALTPLLRRNWAVHLMPNRLGLNLLCGFLAFVSTVFFFLAVTHLPLADVIAFLFARPIFAAITAALILGESLRGNRILAIAVGIFGAVIVVRPGFGEFNVGILYALGTLTLRSWNPINRKILSRSEHPDTVVVWNVLVVAPLALLAAIFFWTTPTLEQIGWMALIGWLETLNQRSIARAYLQGDAIIVTGLQYSRLPIAALAGLVLFGEVPEIWIWIGGAVIASAGIILARGELAVERTKVEARP